MRGMRCRRGAESPQDKLTFTLTFARHSLAPTPYLIASLPHLHVKQGRSFNPPLPIFHPHIELMAHLSEQFRVTFSHPGRT